MKITSQTTDELVLKEGNLSGTIIGVVLVIAGGIVAYKGHSSSPIAIWIALGLVVLGLGLILFSSAITVTANKATGRLLYQKKRIIGGSTTTYAVADVFRIETRKQWQMENANTGNQNAPQQQQPVLVAQSVIVFKNGQELPLDHQKTSSSLTTGSVVLMGGQGAESAIANQVANFLNVPFQEIAPPAFGGGIQINIG